MSSATVSSKLRHATVTDGCEAIMDLYRENGAVIIKGLLTADQVRRINEEIQPAMDRLEDGSNHKDDWLNDFHGAHTKRLTNLVTLSKTFREEVLDYEPIHKLCEDIFLKDSGTYWLNTAQIIEIGPGSKAQPLHRDQWQYPIFTHCGPDAPEAVTNFLVALTKSSEEAGATRIVPGSHNWPDFRKNGTPEDTIPAEMEAGDACFFSGKLVHGGGANTSRDFKRRCMAVSFQCSYITPEEACSLLVEKALVKNLSPRAQSVLGFRSQFPKDSPGLWKCSYEDIEGIDT